MGYFPVRYDSRVVIYDRRGFIRLATEEWTFQLNLVPIHLFISFQRSIVIKVPSYYLLHTYKIILDCWAGDQGWSIPLTYAPVAWFSKLYHSASPFIYVHNVSFSSVSDCFLYAFPSNPRLSILIRFVHVETMQRRRRWRWWWQQKLIQLDANADYILSHSLSHTSSLSILTPLYLSISH